VLAPASPTSAAVRPGSSHVSALDGIRGLAILMVLGHHLIYINAAPTSPIYVWARAVRDSLWCGVDVFFALSGFLITGILIKTVAAPGFFRNFYARRVLRIFPLYYGVLLVLFAVTPLLHIHWGGQQWSLLTYSNHILLNTHDSGWNFYFGGYVNLVNFWSLHVEEQFYLIWPLIVFYVRDPLRLLPLTLLFSLASLGLRLWLTAHGVSHEVLYATLLTRSDNLLLGAALALLIETRFRDFTLRAARPIFAASIATLATIFIVRRGLLLTENLSFSIQFTLLALASTALIGLCLDPHSPVPRLFSTRPLRFFGKYSYGLYIFHSVLPIFLLPPLLRALAPLTAHGHALLQHLLTSLAELIAAVLVSVLSYRYFETPFLRLKKHFEYFTPPTIPELSDSSESSLVLAKKTI
jgi:peptidoglycan/LPS O-acetylase OafA/YrhL